MAENDFPEDLRYDADNSWVKAGSGVAVVGISSFAAKKVKEFIFVKLPEKGKVLKKGETYISVEAVKWSGHFSSPLSGKIIDVNAELFDEPSKINKDPYGSWIMKVALSDEKELSSLMSADEAKKAHAGK